ncbi:MAG: branched-chain amino acid aminotransferase [Prevotellaceae bacterium]|jgi:branched-chain amino acid aminotransferase|nr:branched-chain amino acid aminotransferase [Prevotellaceae bacterium]
MDTPNLEWGKLPFGYIPTDYNTRCLYSNGAWGEVELSSSPFITLHIGATALHYGQGTFEGMKAFLGVDGKVRVFRWQDNWERICFSSEGVLMPAIPKDKFKKAVFETVKLNQRFIPPYGTGASLYIRPLIIGSGAKVGVSPADEYMLIVFVTPVGPYFPQGFKGVDIQLVRDVDRAAPLGTGRFKVGGNYAASLSSLVRAGKEGFKTVLYLDAKEKKYIDECGPANFFGIKNNTYITPDSTSILRSITNLSLCTLAEDMGMKVERRRVPVEELSEFEEAGACGTAAIITPIKSIQDRETGKVYTIGKGTDEPGPVCTKLYNRLQGIQYGTESDRFGWTEVVE